MGEVLKRLTDRVWVYPFEEERDRPNLGYVRGDRLCMAVDAGHSDDHIAAFYRALEDRCLPLPDVTVLTHWHWDHCFAMHAAHGLTLANARTDGHLRRFKARVAREGDGAFLSLHESVRREYAAGRPVVIVPADLVYTGEARLELGGCTVRAFEAPSPHTDDSTLVHIPGEGVLFVGDACGGAFPTGERDAALAMKLAGVISALDAKICVEGHWVAEDRDEVIKDLLS